MVSLSLNELKTIAKTRGIKGYKRMSEERILSVLNETDSVKESEKNFDDARIEKIKKDFNKLRDRLSKPKMKEIRKDLYRIKNEKSLSTQKIEKIEKNLSKLKKFHNYDDIEYKGTRDVKSLFDLSIDEDYYKTIKTNYTFNSNYIKCESKGDKNKTLSIKECLYMIIPYLRDIINHHKTQGEWNVHSGNEVIDYKTQGEWKIQLAMIINSISSKDSNEIRTMCTKSNNIEFLMGNETDEVIEESLLQKYQEGLEEKMRGNEFVFDSIRLFYYNLHEISLNRSESYIDSLKSLKNKKATINQKNNDDNCFNVL